MEKVISFERVRKIVLENIDRLPALQANAEFAVAVVKKYLDDGTILATRQSFDPKCPSAYNLLKARIVEFVSNVDVRCIGELLELCPPWVDNRLPGWLYKQVNAYMDCDTGEWMLEPRRAA